MLLSWEQFLFLSASCAIICSKQRRRGTAALVTPTTSTPAAGVEDVEAGTSLPRTNRRLGIAEGALLDSRVVTQLECVKM